MKYTDYEEKEVARKAVWDVIDNNCSIPIKNRKVMILECGQAGEIIHLLGRGYKPANIHAVNWQRSELAGATNYLRHRNYPDVQMHTGDLLQQAALIRPDVINYDGCGPMGAGDNDNYTRALLWQLADQGMMNITHLVGRDHNKKLRALLGTLDGYTARMVYMSFEILKSGRPNKILESFQLPGKTLDMLYTIVKVV